MQAVSCAELNCLFLKAQRTLRNNGRKPVADHNQLVTKRSCCPHTIPSLVAYQYHWRDQKSKLYQIIVMSNSDREDCINYY